MKTYCPLTSDNESCHENCAWYDLEYQCCSIQHIKKMTKEIRGLRELTTYKEDD